AAASIETAPHVRSLLGAFLFSGDAVEKRTAVLSGGERSRLALAKLLVEPSNCLLLDEPTNHLDLTAKEVLLEALLAYKGTLVLVAHDRYLLDRLPTQVIEVGGGKAVRYLGNYEDYLRAKASAAAAARKLAHLDREAPVDRPGHLGDDAPHLLSLIGHDPCDQLSGRRGGLSTRCVPV